MRDGHWAQGDFAFDDREKVVDPLEETATTRDIFGWLKWAGLTGVKYRSAKEAIAERVGVPADELDIWHDGDERTAEDVASALEVAAAHLEAKSGAVSGGTRSGKTRLRRPPIERIVATIAEKMNPERIVLFGSYARGNARPDSDVDVMVEMASGESLPRRAMAIDAFFLDRDWAMDVFVFTPEEVRRDRNRLGTLVHAIEREGKVLYRRRN